MIKSKTFLVTIDYDKDQETSQEFSDENLAQGLKFVTEASFTKSVQVRARRAFVPEEVQEKKEIQSVILQ